MDKKRLDEILDRLLDEAAGKEHERLKSALAGWASEKGFRIEFSRLTNGIPDVLRGTDEQPAYLFVGDAKDSAHETADVFATWERIRGYVRDFAALLGDRIHGGTIAIATNSLAAAKRWVPFLNAMAESARLSSADGTPPNFVVHEVDARTYFVHW